MRLPILVLLLLAPLLIFAQSATINGKITNADTHAALAKASVFLTETSYGTITNDDGTFTLKGLKPGKYLLVVTMVGFEKFTQDVSINADATQININLKPSVTVLHEVRIGIPKDWKQNYNKFVKLFIGNTAHGRKCKILNSEVLNFSYNKKEESLSAWSDDFIQLENRALGYMVKILLTKSSLNDGGGSWYAQFYFEELPGTPDEIKKWEANRTLIKNTQNHFFASEKLPSDLGNHSFQTAFIN